MYRVIAGSLSVTTTGKVAILQKGRGGASECGSTSIPGYGSDDSSRIRGVILAAVPHPV